MSGNFCNYAVMWLKGAPRRRAVRQIGVEQERAGGINRQLYLYNCTKTCAGEPAREKVAASKFRLGSYKDANGQRRGRLADHYVN